MLEKFLEKYNIGKETKCVVACSGGPDSMFLLYMLKKELPTKNLIVAHLNHKVRKEAADDQDFVRDYCTKHDLTFETKDVDNKKLAKESGLSVEEAGRNLRQEFLEQVRSDYEADHIFTAHHLSDQVETLMFRIIRGTKMTGLVGIPEKQGFYLRPLLHMTKPHILTMLKDLKISYCEDVTNKDTLYTRNHIRHNIVPQFIGINQNYAQAFDQLATYANELKSWIDSHFSKILEEREFSLTVYQSFPAFLQTELIRAVYEECNDGTIGLSEANIAEVKKFIEGEHGNKIKEIRKMNLFKKGGKVTF